jgi:hypothetical protein
LVNSLFNFYPTKRQISLKHELKGKVIDFQNNINGKNLSEVDVSKNNKEHEIFKSSNNINIIKNKNNISDENNNNNLKITVNHNNLFKLFSLNNNNDLYPRKSYFMNKFNYNSIREENENGNKSEKDNKISHRDKSYKADNLSKSEKASEDNNKSKSKVCLLTFELENKNNFRLFNKSQILKTNGKSNINFNDMISKNIKVNIFYYYCFSKFIKDKSYIKQFKFAISFLKKKMDIIYLLNDKRK